VIFGGERELEQLLGSAIVLAGGGAMAAAAWKLAVISGRVTRPSLSGGVERRGPVGGRTSRLDGDARRVLARG
jgi:hypothetical protein